MQKDWKGRKRKLNLKRKNLHESSESKEWAEEALEVAEILGQK